MKTPCEHCPWRVSNHGKRTPWGFYAKKNIARLWNQIRRGGAPQGCHPTDPSHPDHVAAGAKAGAKTQECAGAVILVYREFNKLADCGTNRRIDPKAIDLYLAKHKDGLTKSGLMYWLVGRYSFGGTIIGGPKIPDVDLDFEGVGRL